MLRWRVSKVVRCCCENTGLLGVACDSGASTTSVLVGYLAQSISSPGSQLSVARRTTENEDARSAICRCLMWRNLRIPPGSAFVLFSSSSWVYVAASGAGSIRTR